MEIFTIKHNGMKLNVRVQAPHEKIKKTSLQFHYGDNAWALIGNDIDFIKKQKFFPSYSVGEGCGNMHSKRLYVEVVSGFYKGESLTENEYIYGKED